MAIKPHIPRRTLETNPFNKDMLKGHYEKINDWDLDVELKVWEPETLSLMRLEGCTELEYKEAAMKLNNTGYFEVNLVPYREQPTLNVKLQSRGATTDTSEFLDSYTLFTNTQINEKFAKRFYSFVDLEFDKVIEEPIYSENSISEIINNDNSFKQTNMSISRVEKFQFTDNSTFRSILFKRQTYSDVLDISNTNYIDVTFSDPEDDLTHMVALGKIGVKDALDANIEKKIVWGQDYDEFNGVDSQLVVSSAKLTTDNGGIFNIVKDRRELTDNAWEPHLVQTRVHDDFVNFNMPWVWEYWYSLNQVRGEYWFGYTSTTWLGSTNSRRGSLEYLANLSSGATTVSNVFEAQDLFSTELFPEGDFEDSPVAATIWYSDNVNSELGDNAIKNESFFIPYGVEYALPNSLSVHGALYQNGIEEETQALGIGVKYTDNGASGLREVTSVGRWRKNSHPMSVDYAVDGNSITAESTSSIYLSEPVYSAFFTKNNGKEFKEIVQEIIDGDPVYNSILMDSNLGIHSDIKDQNYSQDIRKWSEDSTYTMLLFPQSVMEMAGAYRSDNELLVTEKRINRDGKYRLGNSTMRNLPVIGPKVPKIDEGILDFRPNTMRTNDLIGYSNIPLDNKYWVNDYIPAYDSTSSSINRGALNILLEIDENQYHNNKLKLVKYAPLEIELSSYGGKQISIKWLKNNEIDSLTLVKEVKINSEYLNGRKTSGGIRYTIM